MDPEQLARRASKHIAKRVQLDHDTLTYRLLSRELGTTVAVAKGLLRTFADEQATPLAVVWLLSGTLAQPTEDHAMHLDSSAPDSMDLDDDSRKRSAADMLSDTPAPLVAKRTILLVPAAQLQDKLSLFSPAPSTHIYSLSAAPLDPITLLTSYDLPLQSPSIDGTGFKWAPSTSFEYGGITLVGAKARAETLGGGGGGGAKGKGKVKEPIKVVGKLAARPKAAPSTAVGGSSNFLGASSSKTTDKGKTGEEKPSKTSFLNRPMGARGGLFANSAPPPPAVEKKPVVAKKVVKKKVLTFDSEPDVPASKKTVVKKSPPKKVLAPTKKAGKGNGIFEDEEVSDDDWAMDEEAMKEVEEQALKDAKKKADEKDLERERKKREVAAKKQAVKDRAK